MSNQKQKRVAARKPGGARTLGLAVFSLSAFLSPMATETSFGQFYDAAGGGGGAEAPLSEGSADSSLYAPRSPDVQVGLELAADLLEEYAMLMESGDRDDYADFRTNRLEPGIRKTSVLAAQTREPEVLYCALALASCDERADERGAVWGGDLKKAVAAFSSQDIDGAFSRIPMEKRASVKRQILRDLSEDSPMREVMKRIPDGTETDGDTLGTGSFEGGQTWKPQGQGGE